MAESRIRNIDPSIHRAAKVAAAYQRVSYNRFVLDAIEAHVRRVAQHEPHVAELLQGKRKKS